MKKKTFIAFLMIGAISMIVMSFHYLYSDSSGILRKKEIATYFWYLIIFRTHVLLGLFAITVGPFQFVKNIRVKYKKLHKLLGYLYVITIIFSSLSSILIAQFSMGGWITTIGFSVLGVLWFFTTIKSVVTIRNRDLEHHRKWAYFSYALTFSAITQRTLLLIPLLTTVPFMPIYQLSAWLPWLLNLGIASLLLKR